MSSAIFLIANDASIKIAGARQASEDSSFTVAYIARLGPAAKSADLDRLASLLAASPSEPPNAGWLILPRPGMNSAWSSKAQTIASSCGIDSVELLEQAFVYAEDEPEHDRMLETAIAASDLERWISQSEAQSTVEPSGNHSTMTKHAEHLGLQLDSIELARISALYQRLQRPPTDAELLMMAQTNSEHCRHKIFRSTITGTESTTPLFDSIRATHKASPTGTLVAYDDNAAIVALGHPRAFGSDNNHNWQQLADGELTHTVIKAETHNHPTGISPFPGAATGCGGEIRDEAAAGRGAASHAGFAGYVLSNLAIPDSLEPWEQPRNNFPNRLATPLQILLEAPLGAAAFGNEFGRPTLAGFFRTCETEALQQHFGFHKPLMIAGGMGEIGANAISKLPLRNGDLIVQLGGPGLRIGVSGGAASSNAARPELDYASVQRDNAEMQRRAQEAIDVCRLAESNPIRAIHDVGAGGIGNAVAELAGSGGCIIELDDVPVGQADLSAAEIWCNEAQERYVAGIDASDLELLKQICAREHCPIAVLGKIADDGMVRVLHHGKPVIELASSDVFGGGNLADLAVELPVEPSKAKPALAGIELDEAIRRVLRHPAVADKSFLITIADRTVGGLTARDQLVGPWQTAVSDCAVTLADHISETGRAMALGERPNVAVWNPAAAARLAIAESLTNLLASDIRSLDEIKLSLNWMAACDSSATTGELVSAVRGVCDEFLLSLSISVPVGKDSLSMRIEWDESCGKGNVRAPATCVASAFAPVTQAAATFTPQLSATDDTVLLLLRASNKTRLGGSVLEQAFNSPCSDVPDVQSGDLKSLLNAVRMMRKEGIVHAYHDISDGGLLATVAEMGFAANCGVTLVLDSLCQPRLGLDVDGYESNPASTASGVIEHILDELFCEEIGAVVQVSRKHADKALEIARGAGIENCWPQTIGWPNKKRSLQIMRNGSVVLDESIDTLRRHWSALSSTIRAKRDDPVCAAQEAERDFANDSGLFSRNLPERTNAKNASTASKPDAVVLREQGTNGQLEMAAALDAAGFAVRILTVSDLLADSKLLDSTKILTLPGGFSFGDTLGAGRGQAQVVLCNPTLRKVLTDFFARDTLTLGICNGCQVLSQLTELLPESAQCAFPKFVANRSRRFEARLAMVEVLNSPSIMLNSLTGAMLPVPVSSGEGRAVFDQHLSNEPAPTALRYVDHNGKQTQQHPYNPSGAEGGACGFSSPDGRFTILMPHPERAVRTCQLSWHPDDWNTKYSTWLEMFSSAHKYCSQSK